MGEVNGRKTTNLVGRRAIEKNALADGKKTFDGVGTGGEVTGAVRVCHEARTHTCGIKKSKKKKDKGSSAGRNVNRAATDYKSILVVKPFFLGDSVAQRGGGFQRRRKELKKGWRRRKKYRRDFERR